MNNVSSMATVLVRGLRPGGLAYSPSGGSLQANGNVATSQDGRGWENAGCPRSPDPSPGVCMLLSLHECLMDAAVQACPLRFCVHSARVIQVLEAPSRHSTCSMHSHGASGFRKSMRRFELASLSLGRGGRCARGARVHGLDDMVQWVAARKGCHRAWPSRCGPPRTSRSGGCHECAGVRST